MASDKKAVLDMDARRAALRQALGKSSPSAAETAPPSHWLEGTEDHRALKAQIALFDTSKLPSPYFHVQDAVAGATSLVSGRELINFCNYNYVGLNGHPEVSAAAKAAIDQYGTSVSASRVIAGERALHRELEAELAGFLGAQDCVVFVGGFGTNVAAIGHLFGPRDLVLHDELAHNSIIQGCILSGAKRMIFPHNDWAALDALLERHRPDAERALVAIEGVYSMDGDIPDLPRFIEVKDKYRAQLLVDEAHSLGVLGKSGAGIGEHYDVDRGRVELWMGTLSKSLASCGGYIAGTSELATYLRYRNPGFVYSVGMSPPNAAAALQALRVLRREPERVLRLRARSGLFLELARAARLNTGPSAGTAVVPVIVGDTLKALRLAAALGARGISSAPVGHPIVAKGQERLRFFVCADHTEQQIRHTVTVMAEELSRL